MKNESSQDITDVQKPEATIESPESTPCLLTWSDRPQRLNRQIDLSPLRSVIENDGLTSLVRTLRDIHHDYVSVLIENDLYGEINHIDEACKDELDVLKMLADALDDVWEVNVVPY